jgi:hypothetical protein
MIKRVQIFSNIIVFIVSHAFFSVNGQDYVNHTEPVRVGLLMQSVSFSDPWSSFNNQLVWGFIEKPTNRCFCRKQNSYQRAYRWGILPEYSVHKHGPLLSTLHF